MNFPLARVPAGVYVEAMTTTTETANISKYTISELHAIIPEDRWAARDEAQRRHNRLAKQLAKIRAEMDKLEAVIVAAR